ncbi:MULTISPECIES: RNA-binding cell elongation regulator Jag/EloR [unclassified Granulicatella]|uniref:RNA-binding cell elongation regulator Jag/EloR n=1 Tax=unclassified Granulicatella TaxID=2630493 RepID=UPI0010743A9E|nr:MULTISPECIES: RNA-binding cell elongation regulator Jag/EloR [unclassified Granulicatella]MBF0781013.1 protein jag [Granulicatella sp. 19428wC4_WM01]TFU92585.1 protein jag [Granulicatella sp. WM01]
MEKLVIQDKTVEQAISKGLIKLNITKDEANIVVKDEGKKGIFGFGQKDAIIEISKKESIILNDVSYVREEVEIERVEEIEKIDVIEHHDNEHSELYQFVCQYLSEVSKEYGADITVQVKETSKKIIFQIETEKAGLLIGKHGKIINALQILAQTLVYRDYEKAPMVVVNIGDYRQKREEKLREIADRTAKRVLKTKQAIFLEPLPAFERKIVHACLSKYEHISTHSEGKEPYRYLVVSLGE